MVTHVLWSAVVWTLKGLLCCWNFFWVNPYCAIKSTPWIPHESNSDCYTHEQQFTESERKHNWEKSCHSKHGNTLQTRLLKAEVKIRDLTSQIANQRASWEMRFMELQKRQHDLRNQLYFEIANRSSASHKANHTTETKDIFRESDLDNAHNFQEKKHGCSSGLNQIHQLDMKILHNVAYLNILTCSQNSFYADSRSKSAKSINTSAGSWKSGTCRQRAFIPHSPKDLQIGHRVRALLPTGQISTGTLRYLGQPHGSSDFYLGVELEMAENVKQTDTYEGQCYFDCKPGQGAFVAFSKLLLAWE